MKSNAGNGFSTHATRARISADAVTPDRALRLLRAGNESFRQWHLAHPQQSAERRTAISQGQRPVAQVLMCSDCYVLPEVIFDQGLGDLLIAQVAGNVVDDSVKATMEYGAGLVGVPLIVVLGHRNCGVVTAALHAEEVHGQIGHLMDAIFPAVIATRGKPGNPVNNAVRANAMHSVDLLRNCRPTLYSMSKSGEIRIVGAVYDPKTGVVDWLDH